MELESLNFIGFKEVMKNDLIHLIDKTIPLVILICSDNKI